MPLKKICYSGIRIRIWVTDTDLHSQDTIRRRLYGIRYTIILTSFRILSHKREYTEISLSGTRHPIFCTFQNPVVQDYLEFRLLGTIRKMKVLQPLPTSSVISIMSALI